MIAAPPIVIGTDGSDFSAAALRRGLWLAHELEAPALIVRAWTISSAPRPSTWEPGYVPPAEDFEAAVRERLVAETEDILNEYPEVDATLLTPHGAAVPELLKACANARILVVGSRGQGGFRGLLLGSVTDQLVEHAPCDVLVVRTVEGGDPSPGRRTPVDRILGQAHADQR